MSDDKIEGYKSVAVMIQFNTSSLINVVIEDTDSNAKELSELAKKLAFEILEKAKKVRG